MRLLSILSLIFCYSATCWAQDQAKTYKHQLGINAGIPTKEHWGIYSSNFYEPEIRAQMPIEICYKRALAKNYFFRLGAGAWYGHLSGRKESSLSPKLSTASFKILALSSSAGVERQLMISPLLRLAFGIDIIARYGNSNFKYEPLPTPQPDSASYFTASEYGKSTSNTVFISPFAELQYQLSKRFVLVGQSNVRMGYSLYKTRSIYLSDGDEVIINHEGSRFLFQAGPVAHVALYYCF
ncbi:MAG: hypothetical protein EAZ57_05435 [Cytophagales bacterium]|nr:MAG: hypothetical protein EAZ67_06145 [Cytophagales bacterium]TAF60987.1 MAG: hypothetical protein EAZ57_05435 [Cytophagales bacterium]